MFNPRENGKSNLGRSTEDMNFIENESPAYTCVQALLLSSSRANRHNSGAQQEQQEASFKRSLKAEIRFSIISHLYPICICTDGHVRKLNCNPERRGERRNKPNRSDEEVLYTTYIVDVCICRKEELTHSAS